MAEKIPAPVPSEEELEKEQKFREEKIKKQAEIEKSIFELQRKIRDESINWQERLEAERELNRKLENIGNKEKLEQDVRESLSLAEKEEKRKEAIETDEK